uniref:Uncharacterized protein n=1 Tax=Ditylum brightwellii TaxID=49249 RepID=A0A7S4S3U3_9STRA
MVRLLKHITPLTSILTCFHLYSIPTANGCGGFWCNNNLRLNQAAENILFIQNQNKTHPSESTVTAVVQILYDGPSERFAWLLPVPTEPEVDVSSNEAFVRLMSSTDPQFVLEELWEGNECQFVPDKKFKGADVMANTAESSASVEEIEADVTVVKADSVGPYDYVLIKINPDAESPAEVAVDWLQENDYDVFDSTATVLDPYLQKQMMLLAFRLTKGGNDAADVGSIRPVVLTYKSEKPMIPLLPTAVAANDDMGIRVWVASDHPVYPANYNSLVLNEALIHWFDWRSTYNDVVTAAANEAEDGQGFVTELALPTANYKDAIFSVNDEEWWKYFQESYVKMETTDSNGFDAIQEASWKLRFWDGWRETVAASVLLPKGVSMDDFGTSPFLYQDQVQVNLTTFLQLLEINVVLPLKHTQDLLNQRPYLTRMYTTMSAWEMTEDPVFDSDELLPQVSNVHTANITVHCNNGVTYWDAPWTIYISGGGNITGVGRQFWPYLVGDMPATSKVEQLSYMGASNVIRDNQDEILRTLEKGPIDRTSGSYRSCLCVCVGKLLIVASFLFLIF